MAFQAHIRCQKSSSSRRCFPRYNYIELINPYDDVRMLLCFLLLLSTFSHSNSQLSRRSQNNEPRRRHTHTHKKTTINQLNSIQWKSFYYSKFAPTQFLCRFNFNLRVCQCRISLVYAVYCYGFVYKETSRERSLQIENRRNIKQVKQNEEKMLEKNLRNRNEITMTESHDQ